MGPFVHSRIPCGSSSTLPGIKMNHYRYKNSASHGHRTTLMTPCRWKCWTSRHYPRSLQVRAYVCVPMLEGSHVLYCFLVLLLHLAEEAEYQLITIHQQQSIDRERHIDLTPVTEQPTYTNLDQDSPSHPPVASRLSGTGKPHVPSKLPPTSKPHIPSKPHVPSKPPAKAPSRMSNPPPPPPASNQEDSHDYDDPVCLVSSPRQLNLPAPGDYDDPDVVMQASLGMELGYPCDLIAVTHNGHFRLLLSLFP